VLKDGVLQQCDTPRALYAEPVNAFVAGFIGSPAMNLVEARVVDHGVSLGGTFIALAPDLEQRLRSIAAGIVTVGFRPECLDFVGPGEGFPAIVSVIEELGAEAYVYAQLAADADRSVTAISNIIARTAPTDAPAPGECIHLRIKAGSMLLFDAETGARIG
jgi:multiple sugar transport system ATP-binding protein